MNKKILLVLSLVICTALTACFGGNGTGTGSSSWRKDAIVVGIQNDLDSLDPHLAETAGTREVLYNVFEGLVKPDKNGDMVEKELLKRAMDLTNKFGNCGIKVDILNEQELIQLCNSTLNINFAFREDNEFEEKVPYLQM